MSNFFLGQISIYGFNFAPRGWAVCAGQIVPIQQNAALFSLLGTTYGGNGSSTFALPDLRGRTPLHFDGNYPQGQQAGSESVTLLQTEMPAHTHSMVGTTNIANKRPVANHLFAADTSATHNFYARGHTLVPLQPQAVANYGGGGAHGNMQPYLAVNFCIATTGIFPSRN
ncbi:MAG: tail fiber protein [Sphingomonas sp.]